MAKNSVADFNSGDRVKINTGGRYIESVDDYVGTVIGPSSTPNCVKVSTPDGDLSINVSRLEKA